MLILFLLLYLFDKLISSTLCYVSKVLGLSKIYNIELAHTNVNVSLDIVKQRLKDTFVQNWNSRLNDSFCVLFDRNVNNFGFKASCI